MRGPSGGKATSLSPLCTHRVPLARGAVPCPDVGRTVQDLLSLAHLKTPPLNRIYLPLPFRAAAFSPSHFLSLFLFLPFISPLLLRPQQLSTLTSATPWRCYELPLLGSKALGQYGIINLDIPLGPKANAEPQLNEQHSQESSAGLDGKQQAQALWLTSSSLPWHLASTSPGLSPAPFHLGFPARSEAILGLAGTTPLQTWTASFIQICCLVLAASRPFSLAVLALPLPFISVPPAPLPSLSLFFSPLAFPHFAPLSSPAVPISPF